MNNEKHNESSVTARQPEANLVWEALALHLPLARTMNYNRGNNGTFAVAHDNTVPLIMELDRLCQLAETPIETCAMTNEQARWLFAVIRERPAWSHPTLARYGYTQAANEKADLPTPGE